MERKKFLTGGLAALGLAVVAPFANSCKKESTKTSTTTSSSSSSSSSSSGSCTVTSSETAGPYPTITPSGYVRSNIVDGQSGVPLTIKLTFTNTNNSCAALTGALVDIWHCTALGYYSEYIDTPGGSYASVDYTASHFLRGRQTTDSNGLVTFTSIFPGWYSPRAPHIHVHVYNSAGTSLLITQIALPTDVCNTVYTTASPYSARGEQDTANTADMVFSDSLANELSTVTGSVSAGYVLTINIGVPA
ncbi:dioxygenase-like protein [Mucilaginibacter frigoritolerans]|jgi:protocatechuate 3,4-dioxygenase beta subunit|uniref:Dioxygenase-like protein n=1 Tax=Mucilaginibacter frigoritolerans TaxID=652788 RepID=A0A562U9C4_9SPHI|nr:intradiol ring-cleavage dioxygenase [Mucilaginibacter frigoritolerans]TWJ02406.1 dioxygenase-like protein [Mucilaginibacter frigoritolerans]